MKTTPIVNWLKRERNKGYAPIVVFCGRQRSGKTAFAMRCAWELYPDKFKFQEHVVKVIESFAKAYQKNNNSVIILDEASDSLYVYDWNSLFQRVFSIINDSQAFKLNTVFLVLPMVHKLGKIHRFDVDAVVEVTRYKNFDADTNTYKNQVFYKYQKVMKRYSDLSMRPPRVLNIVENCGAVPLPPDHIWKPYLEAGQKEFKEQIMEKQINAILKKMNPKTLVKPKVRLAGVVTT